MTERDPRYTIKEARRLLGMSHQAIHGAIDRGTLAVREEDEFQMTKRVYRFLRLSEINRYRTAIQGKEPLSTGEAEEMLGNEGEGPPERTRWSRQELVTVGSV